MNGCGRISSVNNRGIDFEASLKDRWSNWVFIDVRNDTTSPGTLLVELFEDIDSGPAKRVFIPVLGTQIYYNTHEIVDSDGNVVE